MSVAASNTVAILLAAGRSRRFGSGDKIHAELEGRPLIAHAAAALAALPFARRLVVTAPGVSAPQRFETVSNAEPERGIGYSIALGVAEACRNRPAAILIALADMPLVPASHFNALLEGFNAESRKIATAGAGARAMVPAVFDASLFDALASLDGDRGAQALLANAPLIAIDPALLLDVDRPADLFAAAARLG